MAVVQNALYLPLILALLSSPRGATATVVATSGSHQDDSGEEQILEEHEETDSTEIADDKRSADGQHPLDIDKQWVKLEFSLPINNAAGAPRRRRSSTGVIRAPYGVYRRRWNYLAIDERGYGECPGNECKFYIEYVARRRGVSAAQWPYHEYTIMTAEKNYLYVYRLDYNSPHASHIRWGSKNSASNCPYHASCAFQIEQKQGKYKIEAASNTRRRDGFAYYGALAVWGFADITQDVAYSRRRWHWVRWNRCPTEGPTCECSAANPCEMSISVLPSSTTTTTRKNTLLQADDADAPEDLEANTEDSDSDMTDYLTETDEEEDASTESEPAHHQSLKAIPAQPSLMRSEK